MFLCCISFTIIFKCGTDKWKRPEEAHRKENIESTDQSFSDDLIWIIAKGICPVQYEPREQTGFFKYVKTKMQITITAQLISAFVFAT